MSMITKPTSTELAEFDQKLVDKVAKDWVEISAKVQKNEHVMISYDIGGRQLAKSVARLSAQKGARVWYRVRDKDLDAELITHMDERNNARYFAFANNETMQADVVFIISAPRTPELLADVPIDKMKINSEAAKPIQLDYRVEHTRWQLILWPTQAEADNEGLTLDEYVDLFFKSCNQPWDKIAKAQDILVDILDNGKQLTLIANPNDPDEKKRTHLEMSIEGMHFLNSTIDNNFPGSEVFSSPVKTSVNGQMFAPGKQVLGHESKTVEDVYFEIKDGKIVKAESSTRQKEMNEMLDRDEGARFFGEVAFGTNPGLRRPLLNGLLNEKVGGSFHITPGAAYKSVTNCKGESVDVYNGNDSSIHWDITILMLPNYGGGEVIVDGKTIQKDGKFLTPGLEVLNKGLN